MSDTKTPRRVAVFGGTFTSRVKGADEAYDTVAYDVGNALALNNIQVVTGAGAHGLMGACARGALAAFTIRPVGYDIEGAFKPEDTHAEIDIVRFHDFFARLKGYWLNCDGFIVLPGGIGTYQEILTVIAMARCGIGFKPIMIVNTRGYLDPLLEIMRRAEVHGWLAHDDYDKFESWDQTNLEGMSLKKDINRWLRIYKIIKGDSK